jgi:hypothetical protein
MNRADFTHDLMHLTPATTASPASPKPGRSNGPVTIYQHRALFDALTQLLARRSHGRRGPRNPSQFFQQQAIRLIQREGRKHGVRIPADLTED